MATCFPLEVVVPPADVEDDEIGDFDSKIEIRSLIPFFIAGELILNVLLMFLLNI